MTRYQRVVLRLLIAILKQLLANDRVGGSTYTAENWSMLGYAESFERAEPEA